MAARSCDRALTLSSLVCVCTTHIHISVNVKEKDAMAATRVWSTKAAAVMSSAE